MIGGRRKMTLKKFIAPLFILIILSLLSGCLEGEDADKDGLPDNIERQGWDVHVTYPGEATSTTIHVKSSTHKKDTDGDGLNDYEEWSSLNGYITNPQQKDTDKDGLNDYEEIMTFSTDPLHWADDIDKDNGWWKGDYEEILYYQNRGIDNDTIRLFLQNDDVDGDGVKDGNDIDPLKDLKIKIRVKGIKITSNMDDSDNKIETILNLSTDGESVSTEFLIPVGLNYSISLSWTLDLNDNGMPGGNNSIAITVIDRDDKLGEIKLSDEIPGQGDGFAEMDIVKIDGNRSFVNNNFDVSSDCKVYHLVGEDAEIWFEIEDASISP